MRKIYLTFLIILLLGVNINFTYSSVGKNSFKTISYLIKYTDSKILDIKKIEKKYDLENDTQLEIKIKKLQSIKNILVKTQKNGEYNGYLNKIIKQLKGINNDLKSYIKQRIKEKKDESQKYTLLYSQRIKPVLNKIETIVVNIASKFMNKKFINNKDKQIINLLYQIKLKINKLNNLTQKSFNSKKDLQNYIISTFKQITFHFNQIKGIVKK